MAFSKDIWRIGAVRAPIHDILSAGHLGGHDLVWLQDMPPLTFLADPFALWRGDRLYLLAETYDYRVRRGQIEAFVFDQNLRLLERGMAIDEPWHLSYPFLIETKGETYVLPEAFKSGKLTLYRAEDFPYRWAPATTIELDHVPIDATPVFHNGLWWLFYTPATTREAKVSEMHAAYAPTLFGPWKAHRKAPVHVDIRSARPGGTPVVRDGTIILPVQDCSWTYGGGLRTLTITRLTPDVFEAHAGPLIGAPKADLYTDGFHTLSAAGPITLIDVNRKVLSPTTLALDVGHLLRKTFGRGHR